MNSFGPASCLPQGIVSLHPWDAAGPPGIHVPEKSGSRDIVYACNRNGFHDLTKFDEHTGTVQSLGAHADAQYFKIKI